MAESEQMPIPGMWKLAIYTALVFSIASLLFSTLVKGPKGDTGPAGDSSASADFTALKASVGDIKASVDTISTQVLDIMDNLGEMSPSTVNFSHVLYSQQSFWELMELDADGADNFAEYLDQQMSSDNDWKEYREKESTKFHLWNIFWRLGNQYSGTNKGELNDIAVVWITHYASSLENGVIVDTSSTLDYLLANGANGLFDAIEAVMKKAFFIGATQHINFADHTIAEFGDAKADGIGKWPIENKNTVKTAIMYSNLINTNTLNYEIELTEIEALKAHTGWAGLVVDNGVNDLGIKGRTFVDGDFGYAIGMRFADQSADNAKYQSLSDSGLVDEEVTDVGQNVDRVKFVIQDGEITVSAADKDADPAVYTRIGSMTWNTKTAFITFFDNNVQDSAFNFFVSVKITGFRDPVSD
jgi:hypothetical protein